ncbi:hypothetical protein IDG53_01235 [Pelagibacterales bacterium SAG-MED11]|nr:hypothetical protein [Pelagibacterales bacterium SAG-MED11]
MINRFIKKHSKNLYIFFLFLSLILFFFSTDKVYAKSFNIKNIEVSKPFEINFDKNKVIDEGFIKAFSELVFLITVSSDHKIIKKIKLNQIKGMIESFSIKEEKFIDEIYYVNLGVSFNKKKILNFLEKKNIFPSIPIKKKFLFIPIIIEENKENLLVFSNNKFYDEWNNNSESFDLIEYILPTEDLEDLNLIKKQFNFIEQYDFKEITSKYYLDDSIIALIFINQKTIRILSRITVNNKVVLINQSFSNININNTDQLSTITKSLKIIYEDYWKNFNQINTSIKLPISIKVNGRDNLNVSRLENTLDEVNLIYDYYISKFDKDFIYYQIIYNGTPDIFLKSMENRNFNFNTQNKTWVLK